MTTAGSIRTGPCARSAPHLTRWALDLDGDGTAELAWEIAEWQNSFSFYCRGADGALYQVTPGACLENGGTLVAVEQEGPGPVRLIYRCEDDAGQASSVP